MKVSICFLSLIAYWASIVVGSNDKSESEIIVNADDFPYIIIDVKEISWTNIKEKLKNLNDVNMDKLLKNHHDLLLSEEMGDILRGMIIKHCITFHFKEDFTKEEVDLMKDAVKSGLLISKARIESEGSNSEDESSVPGMEPAFQQIKTHLEKRIKEESRVSKMLDNAKYTIRIRVIEYITISLINSKVASFLTELFTLMDTGLPQDNSYYISKIVTKEKVDNLKIEKRVDFEGTRNEVNLMTIFLSSHSIVEDYHTVPPRNRQQISFQNLLIHNHCVRKRMIDALTQESKNILDDARKLKLRSFRNILKIFIGNILKYGDIDSTSTKIKVPLTVADLRSDMTFSLLRLMSAKYKTFDWEKQPIDHLDFIVSGWIKENILISVISREMYRPIREIFYYIDYKPEKSKVAVDAVLEIKLPTEGEKGFGIGN
ncbi:hypothetical protein LSTR_LSTR003199 [Laodelphax striatellus]|uniref:Uncharacterized protein n=1 Tax=Laodelphax striatellus TaxID=195883 RepID=A0A482XTL3_LAOST|nr:hypothetical protein LSTR_LSTR003199 [Laodelphax striatellus]